MKYEDEEWKADREDWYCMYCEDSTLSTYLGADYHGALVDHNFECPCGSSWTFITEGDQLHRCQFVYPRG